MNEKICLFCKSKLEYCPSSHYDDSQLLCYVCKDCPIKYVYFMQGALGMYSMFVNLKDKEYRWDFYHPDSSYKDSTIYQINYLINKNHIPVYKYGMCINCTSSKSLLIIDNPQNITPQNVAQKLKTYLLFS